MYFYLNNKTRNGLVINEIAFSLEDGVDWVEIYNPTMNNVSLEDYYLTDDPDEFSKYKIDEQVIVPANGFVLIYGEDYEGDGIKMNFNISRTETVYLVSKDGRSVVDYMSAGIEDNNLSDFTIGRYPDGSEDLYLMTEYTPGKANVNGISSN